ncbi:MAG: VWA domain-containing protein [Myxococcales bacterium]|nr:VWA domain-containing protein [Myxococcales bacterium]
MSHCQFLMCGAALAMSALTAGTAFASPCPNLMFVVDQSGSMAEDPNGAYNKKPTKWDLARDAVIKIVTTYGDQVPFGLELYTSSSFDDAACYADTKIDVKVGHDTKAKIIAKMKAEMPDSGTNTGEAIKRAAAEMELHDQARKNFIILITDGDPNCNGDEPTYTVQQITAAASKYNIHTFVIGFDGTNGINPDNLNKMAKAGKEPLMGCVGTKVSPCYYSASDAKKFNEAVDKIINMVVGGEFGTAMCDDSCYANGCKAGYVCTTDELDPKPHCIPDPCAGVKETCGVGEFCRQGMCVRACEKGCKANEKCRDGQCVADPCIGTSCGADVCDPDSGQCVPNQCGGKVCKAPTMCDPLSGDCREDQCRIITCPPGTGCVSPSGDCVGTGMGGGSDGGASGGTDVGRKGVSCAMGRPGPNGLALSLLALCGLLLLRRRWT